MKNNPPLTFNPSVETRQYSMTRSAIKTRACRARKLLRQVLRHLHQTGRWPTRSMVARWAVDLHRRKAVRVARARKTNATALL